MALLFSLEKVSFGYPAHPVLREVGFNLHPRERVALVGANGAGKSTLLHVLVGLCLPSDGTVVAFGKSRKTEKSFREVRLRTGLLFQDPDDQLFSPTVLEDVVFGPLNQGKSQQEALEIAHKTLRTLGLDGLGHRVTHKLSGGEKRLVSLATVLAMQPDVLLLDEPTNGLDEETEQRLIEHLESLTQAIVFVSHDRRFVERLATRAVVLQDGTLQDAVLHSHPHSHTHSHLHIHAADEMKHGHQAKNTPPEHGDHQHD
ncbi:MAG: energy-coupling factor ABC transporter ATP-binding protein [Candidatus Thiodiazotropha sp. (ex Monitilora ramsayi)]|nr:energy-coupling factor ABC transporter ATP-binding protein [Candidatus Thiodiazotropha sp. (ex Monitilora ramsayi)]